MLRAKVFVIGAMVFAAGLGFAKTITVASILSAEQFAFYASIFGLTMLGSMLVSAGDLEGTIKLYPRLWAVKRFQEVAFDARTIVVRQAAKILFSLPLVYLAMHIVVDDPFINKLQYTLICGFLAWTVSVVSIIASIIRATGSDRWLVIFSLVRGAMPVGLVILGSVFGDWSTVLLMELLGSVGTILLSLLMIAKVDWSSAKDEQPVMESLQRDNKSNKKLYFANIVSAATNLGDKAIATALLGASVGGAYGVLAIIGQSGQLLAGILSQKVGPEIVKSFQTDGCPKTAGRLLVFPSVVMLLSAVGVLIIWGGSQLISVSIHSFFEERGIGICEMIAAIAILLCQSYLFIEFFVLAMNKEAQILTASISAMFVFVFSILIIQFWFPNLLGFLIAVLVAKLSQVLILAFHSLTGLRLTPADMPNNN